LCWEFIGERQNERGGRLTDVKKEEKTAAHSGWQTNGSHVKRKLLRPRKWHLLTRRNQQTLLQNRKRQVLKFAGVDHTGSRVGEIGVKQGRRRGPVLGVSIKKKMPMKRAKNLEKEKKKEVLILRRGEEEFQTWVEFEFGKAFMFLPKGRKGLDVQCKNRRRSLEKGGGGAPRNRRENYLPDTRTKKKAAVSIKGSEDVKEGRLKGEKKGN